MKGCSDFREDKEDDDGKHEKRRHQRTIITCTVYSTKLY